MWCLAARNLYSFLGNEELGKPNILDYISQSKAAFKMLLSFHRRKKLEGLIFKENSISYDLDFISTQVLTPFSFSNVGVLKSNNLKEYFSHLIILHSRFFYWTTSKPFLCLSTTATCPPQTNESSSCCQRACT